MTRIKSLRHVTGETQENIASLIGITRGAFANIENGKREPDIKTLTILANHFCVTTDYLLGLVNYSFQKDDLLVSRKNRIIEVLVEKNMTLNELSKKSGIPSEVIWEFATLKKTAGMRDCLDSISDSLDLDPAYLIGLSPPAPSGAFYDLYPNEKEWEISDNNPYVAFGCHQAMELEREDQQAIERAHKEEESKKKPVPEVGDGPSESAKRFMDLVDQLTPDQQRLLLAQLQAWIEQNQQRSPAAPQSVEETVPKSDL